MTDTEPETEDVYSPPPRGQLVRDIVVLQFKLIVDGFRDFLLVPASLVAGVISLVSRDRRSAFYELLAAGKRSEHWINLFGALDHAQGEVKENEDIDRLVGRVESFVRDEYRTGRLTGQARERLAAAAEQLQRAAGRKP